MKFVMSGKPVSNNISNHFIDENIIKRKKLLQLITPSDPRCRQRAFPP